MSEPSPGVPASEPAPPPPGTAVLDAERDRVGVVMRHEGPYLQLRPLSGGREWDAFPNRVRPLTAEELLRARLAETNARSRKSPSGFEVRQLPAVSDSLTGEARASPP